MKKLYPKFIINNNEIIVGFVEFHIDLARNHELTIGGGWWYLDRKNNILYLYGDSQEFGKVTIDDVISAKKPVNMEAYPIAFSNSNLLYNVLKNENHVRI